MTRARYGTNSRKDSGIMANQPPFFTEAVRIFFRVLCTWFLNKGKPILLANGCPLANDSARLLTKLISTFGDVGDSNGSKYASIILINYIKLRLSKGSPQV